ncbi:glycoside hydrolase domain-containing protein [Streptomyces clavifer]|uniref:glycoside hydrolase domain-containing protein n=1 Tax=Streptomyces clavifer TaxID=68188 RepID=UPI00367D5707
MTDAANERLDSFFAYEQLPADPANTVREVWVTDRTTTTTPTSNSPQNEPDLIAPYTYLSTGQPWKTTDVVHGAPTLYTDTPTWMTGNDDVGAMSARDVLSSIGIFPVQPGTDTWGLSTPVFDQVDLTLDRRYYPRGSFTVRAPGTSDTDRYIQSARLDGAERSRTYLTTDDIRSGRSLSFEVGSESSAWGTAPADAPPARFRY